MKRKSLLLRLLVIAVVIATMGLPVVSEADSTTTVYADNRPGWEGAAVCYDEESFTDATLNPGVSVVTTYPGYVDATKGVWWDRLVCPAGASTTTWEFDLPIVAFGGNWNPFVPGGPGARIAVAINGSWVTVGEIPETYTGQFWGFVSTVPFSKVRLQAGSKCNVASAETYELDNMVYSCGAIDIDIKPGSDPNSINTKSKGLVAVAILGSDTFDVTTVDVTTLTFGPDSAIPAHDLTDDDVYADHLQDVNLDTYTDLVSHYHQTDTGLEQGATEACLRADFLGGGAFAGCDSVLVRK